MTSAIAMRYHQCCSDDTTSCCSTLSFCTDCSCTPPEDFICPIRLEVMEDPVTSEATGQTYDRQAIMPWLKRNKTCPLTRLPLRRKMLVPNTQLAEKIQNWKVRHGIASSSKSGDYKNTNLAKTKDLDALLQLYDEVLDDCSSTYEYSSMPSTKMVAAS